MLEFRLFDHATGKLLHDSGWQRAEVSDIDFLVRRIGATDLVQITEMGGELARQIDLWMRLMENGDCETILLPARGGGTGKSGTSMIVVKKPWQGTMNGLGEQHLPGKEMQWDLSKKRRKHPSTRPPHL